MIASSHSRLFLALILGAVGWIPAGVSKGQGTKADYERSATLRERTRTKVVMPKVQPHWFAEGKRFWYRRDLPGQEREFILVNAAAGERKPAFDHQRLAESLAKVLNRKIEANQLPIDSIDLDESGKSLRFRASKGNWICDLGSYEITRISPGSSREKGSRFLSSPRVSRRGGEEIHVTFTNRGTVPLQLIWLEGDGGQRSYGKLVPGQSAVQHTFQNHVWMLQDQSRGRRALFEALDDDEEVVVTDADLKKEAKPAEKKGQSLPSPGRKSPDGKWEIRVKEHNVFLFPLAQSGAGKGIQVTRNGAPENGYEERAFWAPDSSRIVVLRRKKAQEHTVHIVESSPKDQVQPKLVSYQYLKPGDEIAETIPHLFLIGEGEPREVPIDKTLFEKPWSLSEFQWMPDSGSFCFLFNQRGHQVLRIVSVDAETGKARALIDETSETFIDYSRKRFSKYLEKSGEWLWMSERDGWNHLYLYDVDSGEVKHQLTRGEWVVRGVDRVDQEKRQVWFHAGGIYPEQDPYQVHYCRVNFDGSDLVVLTGGDGTHSVEYSPDGQYLLATYSRVDLPPVVELRRVADGKKLCELEHGDWSALLDTGWQVPERFVAKARDGKTPIHGVIFRPTNFDPKRSYPVVEKIYAGPHGAFVPKEFKTYHSAQELAELGFIVVQIDGMGTSQRSKAFHDVAWKNLKDAGFLDRIRWMKAAAKKYPYLDLSRVGIYGGSAGGQNAMAALLWHGNFYGVAVADCGCHDNRMDKIWWNEQWMGWPIDKSYETSSNVVNAHRLQGKLLLTVGELDRNVDPASTMQVVDALIKADKDFDMIVVPGADHGVGDGSAYMRRRRADYFVRHLHGVEPRAQ